MANRKALIDIDQSLGPLIKPMHTEIKFTQLNEQKAKTKLEESRKVIGTNMKVWDLLMLPGTFKRFKDFIESVSISSYFIKTF